MALDMVSIGNILFGLRYCADKNSCHLQFLITKVTIENNKGMSIAWYKKVHTYY